MVRATWAVAYTGFERSDIVRTRRAAPVLRSPRSSIPHVVDGPEPLGEEILT